jgi:N-acetyl-gamma-glutamylphosphate reductase
MFCHQRIQRRRQKLIQKYKDGDFGMNDMNSPQMYALGLTHKHLPEMKKISGLTQVPVFNRWSVISTGNGGFCAPG